jgi:glycosyltransferase involved in cell wall biosynthesis
LLVPDLLGVNPKFLMSEARLLSVTHGYWVTSLELQEIYKNLFPMRTPTGVLHDLPDVSLILKTREMKFARSGIIWVGNSLWGSNYGYVDHKGYLEVIQPLMTRNLPLAPIKIRDSAIRRAPNGEVLRSMAESQILIQSSVHEGTGLPLLEALGVGTIPITSDVGIAKEVLTGELAHLIVERNTDSFEKKIYEITASVNHLSTLCISAFDSYIEKVKSETIEWVKRETSFDESYGSFLKAVRVRLVWIYRFYRSRGNR